MIDIRLDSEALSDAGVNDDTPVTRRLHGITLRSLLKLMLSELDLTYTMRDGYLLITTKSEVESMLRGRVLPPYLFPPDRRHRRPMMLASTEGEFSLPILPCPPQR